MKMIKYTLAVSVNRGTEEEPVWVQYLFPVEMDWNPVNETIAAREAYLGEYTVEEVGEVREEV